MLTWDRLRNGPDEAVIEPEYNAHGEKLVKVLHALKRQADRDPGKLSEIDPQDAVAFLEIVEAALRSFGRMEEMCDEGFSSRDADGPTENKTTGDSRNE